MALLILFGFLAGAGTALSPCVLPVLPIALSAGATGGRRRPLGIVAGLAVSFTFATVALVYVIVALGPAERLCCASWRSSSCSASGHADDPAARRAARGLAESLRRVAAAGRQRRGRRLLVRAAVGASLGLVYAPCAGPILAGVITVSASQSFTAGRLAVALAATGSARPSSSTS